MAWSEKTLRVRGSRARSTDVAADKVNSITIRPPSQVQRKAVFWFMWQPYQEFTFEADLPAVRVFLNRCSQWKFWALWSITGSEETIWPYGFFGPDKTPGFPPETEDTKRRPVVIQWVPALHDASCLFCMSFLVTVQLESQRAMKTNLALITLNQKRAGETIATLLIETARRWTAPEGVPIEDSFFTPLIHSYLSTFWEAMLGEWRKERSTDSSRGKPNRKAGAARLEERDDWQEKVKKVGAIQAKLKNGVKISIACQLAGMPESTYRRYCKRMEELRGSQ